MKLIQIVSLFLRKARSNSIINDVRSKVVGTFVIGHNLDVWSSFIVKFLLKCKCSLCFAVRVSIQKRRVIHFICSLMSLADDRRQSKST